MDEGGGFSARVATLVIVRRCGRGTRVMSGAVVVVLAEVVGSGIGATSSAQLAVSTRAVRTVS